MTYVDPIDQLKNILILYYLHTEIIHAVEVAQRWYFMKA